MRRPEWRKKMRKNDFGSKKSSRAKPASGGRSNRGGGMDRSSKRTGERTGERYNTKGGFGKQTEEFETLGRRPRKDGEVGQSGQRRSTDWSTGGYRVTKKATGKGSGFKGYDKDATQGSGRSARDDRQDYRGSRRNTENDFRSPRKDDGQEFRGPRKNTRAGEIRNQKKGYVKKTPRSPINKRDEFRNIKEEIETTRTINEAEIKETIDREDRVEGRNSVFEAMRSGRPLNKLFVEKDSEDVLISRIVAMAREKDIPIQYLEKNKLDSISQTRTHQGVILEVAAKEYVEVEDIMKIAEDKGEKPFVLVLDGITDTNNLGSIIRSAECAGVHGIILPKRRSATLNATVAKVAAGALEYVQVARVTNLVQTLRSLKNEGLWIIGADMDGETNFQEADLTGPTALVIGSEGEGLARLVKDECDLMVKIPMKGKISSLNAGVAAGLIMFEISRQREK